jgi:hypothetical protein
MKQFESSTVEGSLELTMLVPQPLEHLRRIETMNIRVASLRPLPLIPGQ